MNDWLVRRGLAAVSTSLCTLVLACGSSSDGSDRSACVSGRSIECMGPNGCEGYQVCDDDGGSYGPCRCATQPSEYASSGEPLNTGSDAREASGGGSATAGIPTGGSAEVTAQSGAGGSSEECAPTDMRDWSPPAYVPAHSPQPVCTDEEIRAFSDECLLGQDCSPFEADGESAECGACLWPSPLGEARYGPVIELNPRPFYRWDGNVAGCVEISGEAECAEKIQAARACVRESCRNSCGPANEAFGDCMDAARSSSCSQYEADAVCIMAPATAERCTASGFAELVRALGRVFCGGDRS